ncbi:unnamed protein product [Coffea canephora]|uniref:Uncharacterized protein n=1 Tax=Coffea canephora TaxID=49390 RepID=A0A068U6J5_COFCA|nr:unnamed protein product [Coffea canephora]
MENFVEMNQSARDNQSITHWMGTVAEAEDSVPETQREFRLYIKELNKSLAADPRVQICQLPSGDGMTICRRLR